MANIVVVGAGISGLSLAYRLQQTLPRARIEVLEQNHRAGGTVWTVERDGYRFEAGPNGFLDTKPTTLELAQDLGIADQLIAADETAAKKRYLFLRGRLRPLPGGLVSFLRSGVLSWRGKMALLRERFRRSNAAGEDESIDAFARRRAGSEVAEVLADAVVTGIFAGDPAELRRPACFPRLAALQRHYGSVTKGMAAAARQRRAAARLRGEADRRPGKLWSLRRGLGEFIKALTGRLQQPPLLGVDVQRLERVSKANGAKWKLVAADGRSWLADVAVLACPAYRQAGLLASVDGAVGEQVGAIAYNRLAVLALGYRREDVPISVDGFGYIAPERTRRDVLGVQWCSSLYPERAPGGAVLMRAMCGGWRRGDMLDWDDERLLHAVRAELKLAMGITAGPVFSQVIRWERAIPQYHVGHLRRVAAIEERLRQHPGLFLGGNAYYGVALNDCTEQAKVLAAKVQQYLETTRLKD